VTDEEAYISHLGRIIDRSALAESDVQAKRIVGIDYSGKSGAPVVLVVADSLQGIRNPKWFYHVESVNERFGRWEILDPKGRKLKRNDKGRMLRDGLAEGHRLSVTRYDGVAEIWQPSGEAELSVDGNRFTVRRGEVTMVGTVIADSPVALQVATNEDHYQLLQAKNGHHDYRMATWGIDVSGADRWLVVMTVQRGEAPKVRGDGFADPVTVGGQTLRLNGERVVFGKERTD
jgi:hypothetical protein